MKSCYIIRIKNIFNSFLNLLFNIVWDVQSHCPFVKTSLKSKQIYLWTNLLKLTSKDIKLKTMKETHLLNIINTSGKRSSLLYLRSSYYACSAYVMPNIRGFKRALILRRGGRTDKRLAHGIPIFKF